MEQEALTVVKEGHKDGIVSEDRTEVRGDAFCGEREKTHDRASMIDLIPLEFFQLLLMKYLVTATRKIISPRVSPPFPSPPP